MNQSNFQNEKPEVQDEILQCDKNEVRASNSGESSESPDRLLTPANQGDGELYRSRKDDKDPFTEGDYHLRICRPLFTYLLEKRGGAILERVANAAKLKNKDLFEDGWLTHEQIEAVLAAARNEFINDEAFMSANAYLMKKQYGPLFLLFRVTSLERMFRIMAKTSHLVLRASSLEVLEGGHSNEVNLIYRSRRPESRLMCLARQGQWRSGPPDLWNLPPADVRESKCIAWGDDLCEYKIVWREPLRWRFGVYGSVLGGLLGMGAAAGLGVSSTIGLMVLGMAPLLGLSTGLFFAMKSLHTREKRIYESNQSGIQELVENYLDAREELLALHQRQEQWMELLDQQVAERTHTLEMVASRIEHLREKDHSVLRSLSHDLRNPLAVIRGTSSLMEMQLKNGVKPEDLSANLESIDQAVLRLDKMLRELMQTAVTGAGLAIHRISKEKVPLSVLTDRFRRQLQALVIGRDIRVSVFRTRESPQSIETDMLVFDRVMDNMFTNAAKYTERGSIVVELDGMPGMLIIKVSDTGRGIPEERLINIMQGDVVPDKNPVNGDSYGIGLTTVIRMLDNLGGRVEMMSKPGVGSTFWLHLPARQPTPVPGKTEEPMEVVIRRVVTIRKPSPT